MRKTLEYKEKTILEVGVRFLSSLDVKY